MAKLIRMSKQYLWYCKKMEEVADSDLILKESINEERVKVFFALKKNCEIVGVSVIGVIAEAKNKAAMAIY